MAHTTPVYQIIVKGNLAESWGDSFDGLSIDSRSHCKDVDVTVLKGPVTDQAALRGILTSIWDFNFELIAVFRIDESW